MKPKTLQTVLRLGFEVQRDLSPEEQATFDDLMRRLFGQTMGLLLGALVASFFFEGDWLGAAAFLALVNVWVRFDALVKELALDKFFVNRAGLAVAKKQQDRRSWRSILIGLVIGLGATYLLWALGIPQEVGGADIYWTLVAPGALCLITLIFGAWTFYYNRKKIILTD